jgi:group I intron endonuclease
MPAPEGKDIIGIYKFTSPSKKVYIGQSVDITARYHKYRLGHCQGQKRLHASFNKYGFDNHIFEIIHRGTVEELDDLERYYQDLYNVLGEKGLNCKVTRTGSRTGRHSEETKRKISLAHMGKKLSDYHIGRLKAAKQNISEETKAKIRVANLGKKQSAEQVEKLRKRMMGNKHTLGMRPVNARIVINTETGIFYSSILEAANTHGIKKSTLNAMLLGVNPNRTSLKFA